MIVCDGRAVLLAVGARHADRLARLAVLGGAPLLRIRLLSAERAHATWRRGRVVHPPRGDGDRSRAHRPRDAWSRIPRSIRSRQRGCGDFRRCSRVGARCPPASSRTFRRRSRAPWRRPRRSRASGMRGEAVAAAHLPSSFGGDTTVRRCWRPLHLAPPDGRLAWTTPLLDAADRVRGLIVAVGGPQPVTYWYPLADPAVRWPAVHRAIAARAGDARAAARRVAASRARARRSIPRRRGGLRPDDVRVAHAMARRPSRAWRFTEPAQRAIRWRSARRWPKPPAFAPEPADSDARAHAGRFPAARERPLRRDARGLARRRLARVRQGVRRPRASASRTGAQMMPSMRDAPCPRFPYP